jgi:hypothetical protein
MSFELIETKTLSSAAASIEFTSIPQDGTDLLVLASTRLAVSATDDALSITLNSSTSNRSRRSLLGRGSTVASFSSADGIIGSTAGNTATSNTFGNAQIYLPNYTSSSAKSASTDSVSENNDTRAIQEINAFLWNDTAAITSLKIDGTSNLMAGSTISLYKITKGSDGIVTTS